MELPHDKYKHYIKRPAEEINLALDTLPKAEMRFLWATKEYEEENRSKAELVKKFKTIKVTMSDGTTDFVNCPKGRYRIVQHTEAFRPIVEGMTLAGQRNFEFVMLYSAEREEMQIIFGNEVADSVFIGFSVKNSFDSTRAIGFGMNMMKGKKYIEVGGYRQICANGMKIRVPLEEAEYFSAETRKKVITLLSESARIIHTPKAF